MDKNKSYNYKNEKNFVELWWLWTLKENKEWVVKIIKHLLSKENPLWKIKYYEKWRYKKIDKFNYEKDIKSNDRNDLIFYWEWNHWLTFKIKMRLEDRYLWKWEKQQLYSCNKLLKLSIYNTKISNNLFISYLKFLIKNFQITYWRISWIYEEWEKLINIQKNYTSWKSYCMTDVLDPISFIWPFIFKNILNKEEFKKKIKPLVYKLEEFEDGGIYIQVNEKDPFNLTSKENEEKYIEYLKKLNELLPYSAFQSLYYWKEVIEKYNGLEWWWRLIAYIEKRWKEGYQDIVDYIPEVLDKNWELKISDEDLKLLWQAPMAKYNYVVE